MKELKCISKMSKKEIYELEGEVLFLYLYKGYSLTKIEEILFDGDLTYKGWFSKIVLNHNGVSTAKNSGNKGMYKGEHFSISSTLFFSEHEQYIFRKISNYLNSKPNTIGNQNES